MSTSYKVPEERKEQVRQAAMGLGRSMEGLNNHGAAAKSFRRACDLRYSGVVVLLCRAAAMLT